MLAEEIQEVIDKIIFGGEYVVVKDATDDDIFLLIKEMELADKVWIDFIHKQAITSGKDSGLVSTSELAIFLEKADVWTRLDEKEIHDFQTSISKMDDEFLAETLTKREEKRIKKIYNSAVRALENKQLEKNNFFAGSLEKFAEYEKIKAIVFVSAYKNTNNKYWNNWQHFLQERDSILVTNIINEIVTHEALVTKQIREVARSALWRFKWQAAKNIGDGLFGKPIGSLTRSQESLLYWSQVYDSAYEAYERPDDSIIEDDEELDRWFEEQGEKRKKEHLEKKIANKNKGSSRIMRHSEIGFITNPEHQKDIDRAKKLGLASKNEFVPKTRDIEKLNSPLNKKFLEHQRNKIKNHGTIREEDLRSDSNSRRAIGSKDVIFEKARRKDGFTGKRIVDSKPGGTIVGRRE